MPILIREIRVNPCPVFEGEPMLLEGRAYFFWNVCDLNDHVLIGIDVCSNQIHRFLMRPPLDLRIQAL